MSHSPHFSKYLTDLMEMKGMDAESLSRQLGWRLYVPVAWWCRGERLPRAEDLPRLAILLQADPVSLSIVWLIAMCPELDTALRQEVLEPRGISCSPPPRLSSEQALVNS
jgi:hypothetical protein